MSVSRKTNRDHAKKTTRPMVEEEVVASQLEALFRKLGSLEDVPQGQLAGKMGTVIDLMTRLPIEIWFQENP